MIATRTCPYASHLVVEQRLRWWGLHVWRVPLHHVPVFSHWPMQARRSPARACRLQAARWKRRRWVQQLRRTA